MVLSLASYKHDIKCASLNCLDEKGLRLFRDDYGRRDMRRKNVFQNVSMRRILRDQMFNVTSMEDSDGLHVDESIDYTEGRHRRCGPQCLAMQYSTDCLRQSLPVRDICMYDAKRV